MPTSDNIYTALNDELKSFEHRKDVDVVRLIAIANARAQVDQAISLASIADSLDQLVAHFTGREPGAPAESPTTTEPTAQGIQSEHDVEVGDFVAALEPGPARPAVISEVVEVGTDQGAVWLKLAGAPVKVWASQFYIVQRAAEQASERAVLEAVIADMTPVGVDVGDADDIDDDFATDAGDADEQQADALAKLREKQGKSKPKGKR